MEIEKSSQYKKDLKKKKENKHLDKEYNRIIDIERLIIKSDNLKELFDD